MQLSDVRMAFERRIAVLSIDAVLPARRVPDNVRKSVKYRKIARSISEIGIVEPIVVAPLNAESGQHVILDGHIRFEILKDVGAKEVRCLIASDDEGFTYNKRVNRLSTIQEHYMLMRALDRGVSEERLAKSLDVDVRHLRKRRTMLDGIAPEVIELLKDRTVSPITFEALRKMKPMRQITAVELMESAANFSSSYAKAILAATRQTDLAKPDKPKAGHGMTPEQMARMEREMEALQQEFKAVEATYGDDVLLLVIATGYLSKLVGNRKVERYLSHNQPEILSEFRSIITAATPERLSTAAYI